MAFVKDNADPYFLEKEVRYGIMVRKVKWKKPGEDNCSCQVKVSGWQTQTGNEVDFEGDAVILTVPLNIMRQVEFSPALPQHVNDAIKGIRYEPSTKIFLGFRERFWEISIQSLIEESPKLIYRSVKLYIQAKSHAMII